MIAWVARRSQRTYSERMDRQTAALERIASALERFLQDRK
jgi:hypothetical protein